MLQTFPLLARLRQPVEADLLFQQSLGCLYGQGEVMLEHVVKSVRSAWQKLELGPVISLDAAAISEGDWLNYVQSSSLFEDRQLLLIRQADKKAELVKWLQELTSLRSNSTTIILIAQQKELKAPLKKELERLNAWLCQSNDPATWELQKNLAAFAADFGFKIDAKASAALIESQSQDLLKIKNILTIAQEALPAGTLLTIENLGPLLGGLREDHAFRFYDHMLQGNLHQAEALVLNLLERGEKGIAILGIVAGFLRKAIHVLDLYQQGFSERDIAQKLAMPPFQAKQYMSFAKNQKMEKCAAALGSCQRAELTFKSSRNAEGLFFSEILSCLA